MSENNGFFDDGFESEMKKDKPKSNDLEFDSKNNAFAFSAPVQSDSFSQSPEQETTATQEPVVQAQPVAPASSEEPVVQPTNLFEARNFSEPQQAQSNFDSNFNPTFNQYQNPYNPPNMQPNYNGENYNPNQAPVQVPNSNNNVNYDAPHYSANAPIGGEPPKKSKKGMMAVVAVICFCLVVAVAALFVGANSLSTDTTDSVESSETAENETTSSSIEINTDSSEELTAVEVAALVRQSVVGVLCYDSTGQISGEGSGVIISEQNGYTYIITCAHVISDDPASLGILLLDGSSYEAELVGYDEETDIGVIRVEATGLPIIEIGDSSSLQIGETVYAIGNPGGTEFFGSITDGIVSSIDRSFSSSYSITLIQHNAAINPGNSGGALVNSSGQLVGINSSKISNTDYEGMGFAIPTSIAVSIAENLIDYGYVPNRPKLGIEYASISSYQFYSMVATIVGLPTDSLVIAAISSDSTLADTQAQVGDIIIAVNGEDMTDSNILLDLIENGEVGDELVLTLCRIDNTYQTTTFDVTVYLVEDVPIVEETTQTTTDSYDYDSSSSFDDFLEDYFGFDY